MQIKCSKDIGSWFDELSILNVKINVCSGLNKEKSIANFQKLAKEIKESIGDKLYVDMFTSGEYVDLYNANLATFNKIGEAQKTIGLAKEIDVLNYERFLKKMALQKRFFEDEVSEVKVGYE